MTATNSPAAAGYAVADGNIILGTGSTKSDAIADAREWMDAEGRAALDETPPADGLRRDGALSVEEATAALTEQVNREGGDIAWADVDTVLCTLAEAQPFVTDCSAD